MKLRIFKNVWRGDIISPFDFVNANMTASKKADRFHGHNLSFNHVTKDRKRKYVRYGIQYGEEYANDDSVYFHGSEKVNSDGY